MKLFQGMLLVHIAAGCICLLFGPLAMGAAKKNKYHRIFGEIYHASFAVILLSSVTLAVMHWETSAYLMYVGIFSYSFAITGYLAVKLKRKNWLSMHISGMLGSYIAVVTAVLVVNGQRIPGLNLLPVWALWILPTLIGSPLITLVNIRFARRKIKATKAM
ncbi:DUF2306 domain-containing protein [Metabacillus sp. GX 13764]|uniref:DUF2306 domain-containing protein n=1 Tax=Metabacillus kandeliae TaxID=2900151 RepID=UPI001E4DD0C2|nr:DUF2306 domain-containing protein [Metabacillus kandeliae]